MTAWVRGGVQGVGFRWWTRVRALELGLTGAAANLADGRVQVTAYGTRRQCEDLLDWLEHGDTPGRVDGVTEIWGTPNGTSGSTPNGTRSGVPEGFAIR
jgi:acylphosphatase